MTTHKDRLDDCQAEKLLRMKAMKARARETLEAFRAKVNAKLAEVRARDNPRRFTPSYVDLDLARDIVRSILPAGWEYKPDAKRHVENVAQIIKEVREGTR